MDLKFKYFFYDFKWLTLLIFLSFSILFYVSLNGLFIINATTYIGLILFAYVIFNSPNSKKSFRLIFILIPLFLGSWLLKINSFYYLLSIFSLVFFIESLYKKLSILPLSILLVTSMIFKYLAEVFTFPIRIWLGESVAYTLKFCKINLELNGNNISIDGQNFAVETACMGLEMISVSLLFSIFLISFYQNIYQKNINTNTIFFNLLFTFLINILNNFFRILLLVFLKIGPDNIMHEFIGIISFLIYVCIPLNFIIPRIIEKWGNSFNKESYDIQTGFPKVQMLVMSLVLFTVVYNLKAVNRSVLDKFGVTQIKNENALIYIKKIPNFYSAEHSPVFCWKGSGYKFDKIQELKIGTNKVYTADLNNGNESLKTAWWFTNGKKITTSQIAWRWDSFINNQNYNLINVTAESEMELNNEVKSRLEQ